MFVQFHLYASPAQTFFAISFVRKFADRSYLSILIQTQSSRKHIYFPPSIQTQTSSKHIFHFHRIMIYSSFRPDGTIENHTPQFHQDTNQKTFCILAWTGMLSLFVIQICQGYLCGYLDWAGLDWVGLGCIGLSWVGLGEK